MRDDIASALGRAAATPRREVPMRELHAKARRAKLYRAGAIGAGAGLLTIASLGIAVTMFDDEREAPPATTDSSTPAPSQKSEPSPTPTHTDEEPEPSNLEWPDPFVPPTTSSGNRELMPVIFPDKTAATLSYPSELRLAERGVQVTITYMFEEARPNGPHDIIFIRGESPPGLLDPQSLRTFDATPYPADLHAVTYEDLRGDPPYALAYEAGAWTIVVTLPRREDADLVVQNLHPSVTGEGWPSVSASGSLQLSEGFGEARGPHLEIGDKDPVFEIVDAGEDFTYVVMGPPTACKPADDGVHRDGGQWYASKCLQFSGGRPGIVVSIYGPEKFVRSVFEGIALDE